MAGTKTGGAKSAAKNKQRYGEDYYKTIGKLGGQASSGGGFAKDRDFASKMGRLGGLSSKRGQNKVKKD